MQKVNKTRELVGLYKIKVKIKKDQGKIHQSNNPIYKLIEDKIVILELGESQPRQPHFLKRACLLFLQLKKNIFCSLKRKKHFCSFQTNTHFCLFQLADNS